MSIRKVQANPDQMSACPVCGNRSRFDICSDRASEDCCDVWAQCGKCGHRPPRGNEIEDVMGQLDDALVSEALGIWNDAFADVPPVSSVWPSMSDEQRLEFMEQIEGTDVVLTADDLAASVQEMDLYAARAGLSAVFLAPGEGGSSKEPAAAVCCKYAAHRHLPRTISKGGPHAV